jgi:uncharacterized membrane protein
MLPHAEPIVLHRHLPTMTDASSPSALPTIAAPRSTALPADERATAAVAYVCFLLGLFIEWPALLGLALCYARRGSPEAGAALTHYEWLIQSFWTALGLWLAALALLATGMWPLLREARATGADLDGLVDLSTTTVLDWLTLQTPLSLASVGALALVCTYLWFAWRIGRGALRLAANRPVD